MPSRAARLTWSVVTWLAIGGAALFVLHAENDMAERRAATRAFDSRAREAADALTDARVAQQAYVAAGQGVAYWTARVLEITGSITGQVTSLRAIATDPAGRAALDQAASTLTEFSAADRRARDYIKSGQSLMAGDVIFTEGGELAAAAARHIESARLAQQQALEAVATVRRKQEAAALTGAAVVAVIAIALLVPAGRRDALASSANPPAATTPLSGPPAADDLMLRESPGAPTRQPHWSGRPESSAPPAETILPARAVSPLLRATAELCTDLARVTSLDDVTELLGRAAQVMDASGLVVWLGSATGGELRPLAAYGYGAQALARMPTVPRSANNAAAAAYRSGALQIVLARPGSTPGALVAPLLSPDGCIGALSAEIPGGGETSDSAQALAAIFAAELALVLVAPSEADANKTAAS